MKNHESQELWGVFSRKRDGELYMTKTAHSKAEAENIAREACLNSSGDREVYRLIPCSAFRRSVSAVRYSF